MSEAPNTTIRRVDWTEVPPSVAVVETVSEASGRDALDLPTLNGTIDTDALDALYADDGRETEPVTVSFVYAGYEVTMLGDGTIIVEPTEGE